MSDQYAEEKVLAEYVTDNLQQWMTDFERQTLVLALKRSKAVKGSAVADRLSKWISEAGEDVAHASVEGYHAVRARITKRIQLLIANGTIVINRCPACCKIVRTPLARQCLWCGFDWHEKNAS